MNIRFFFTACFLIAFCTLNAQKVGTWTTHLACYNTTSVAEANNYVYAVADGTLYRYGKDDNSIKLYSKQTKLNDTDIKVIRYNPSVKKLLIVYTNGNIDMMDEDDNIKNINSIKISSIIQDKTVNFIYFNGNTAYLAAGFGVLEYRMDKEDAVGTYLNTPSYGVCIRNEFIYASTATGIRKASIHDNLLDPNNWQTVNTSSSDFDSKNIRELYLFNNMVCFRANGSGVYYLDENDKIQTMRSDKDLIGMKLESGHLIPYTSATAYFYESFNNVEPGSFDVVNDISGLKSNGTFWVASGRNGLRGAKHNTAEKRYDPIALGLTIEGPKRNLDAYMTIHKGKLLITGGGRWTNRDTLPGTLMVYENEKWFNFDEEKVNSKVGLCRDYTSVAVDPNDENHYFVSTFGEGILEFKNNEFVQQYNHKNSPLQSALPNNRDAGNYVRVGSVTFDKAGNLWATNCLVSNGIVKRNSDGRWESFPYSGVRNADLVDKILITSKGHKWVNVPRTTPGILVFNDEGKSNFISTFSSGGSGTSIRSTVCFSMAEDLTGAIWIGTAQGPIYCATPSNAIDRPDALTFSHIIRQNDAGDNYVFLESEQINAIAIDGGNRKWLGTSGSGVYVVSPDGKETIHHFTAENDDLYSNTIRSIAINNQTGEVFIGTDKGLISYQSESTEASESYSDVYAYPNPVRLDFDNQVVITGLMANSNVKITDLSGNLIYQGKSTGGQIVWDCRNRSGNHVATGIYLVLSSTEKASESVVAKIAVVK